MKYLSRPNILYIGELVVVLRSYIWRVGGMSINWNHNFVNFATTATEKLADTIS